MPRRGLAVALAALVLACAGAPPPAAVRAGASDAPAATPSAPPPTVAAVPAPRTIAEVLADVDLARMRRDLDALTAFESRDPRHPGHARAVAFLKERLGAIAGVTVESQRFLYQGLALENVFGVVDPPGGPPAGGWILVLAHFDSTAKGTPGWRPALDPAPGADDNGTGTASLLEYARLLAAERATLRQRVVLAFVDGEELFFKGSAAYLASLARPLPYAAVLNIDFVGFNPLADRLDLVFWTAASAGLRDRLRAANERHAIGVAPLVDQLGTDPNVTIMDIAPWGLAGVPAVAVAERYPPVADATYPGNPTVHTVRDTPEAVSNPRLWTKATRLLLAVLLELAR